MANAQRQIRDEQAAVQIVNTLSNYTAVSWGADNLTSFIGTSETEIERGIIWLKNRSYIFASNDVLYLTDFGKEYVAGLKKNVGIDQQSNALKFKNEALTGLREKRNPKSGFICSCESQIKRAALSTKSGLHESATPEQIIMEQQEQVQGRDLLCKKLGLDRETITKYLVQGRIRYCEACNGPGVFHRKGGGRWESVCKDCRKKGKRKKRVTK